MTKLFVDDTVITDAWLIVLYRSNSQATRPLRMLTLNDLPKLHQIRKELASIWRSQKGHREYKTVRDEYLDQRARREQWSPETRNLYASILSTVNVWYNKGGRGKDTLAELHRIWVVHGWILQHIDLPFQRQINL